MKNLYKKISAVVLAGMVVFGGVSASGVQSFAASSKVIESRSLIGNYRGFIGDSKEFLKCYEKLMEDVSEKDYKAYENIIVKIEKIVKGLPGKRNFRLRYVGLPFKDEVIEKLRKEYNLQSFPSSSVSVEGIISSIYRFVWFREKNYIVRFNYGGKNYNFIFYGQDI